MFSGISSEIGGKTLLPKQINILYFWNWISSGKIVRKKTGIIFVGVFAAALAVAAFFIRKDKQVVVVDPWVAVPSDAFFIVETHDFPEMMTRTTDPAGMMSGLSGMKWAASLVSAASAIDSITGVPEVRAMISNRRVIISFHVTGQGRVTPLAVMNSGPSLTPRRLTSLVTQSGATVTDKRELGGTRTFTVTYGKGNRQKPVYIALTSGILIITTSGEQLSSALDNKGAGSDIRHQQGFAPVVSAAGKDADNVYVLFRNLSGFIKPFVDPVDIPAVTLAAIAGGGDLKSTEEGLFISGFLSTAGSGTGADRLKNVAPAECGVHELLPQGTLSYRTVMQRAALAGETVTDPASINATDLALILSPFTGEEVTEARVIAGGAEARVIAFRMTDRQSAENVLRERLTAKYRSMGLKESHFVASAPVAGGEEAVLYKMPFTGVAAILSGESGSNPSDGWVTFARSYMVFSSSPEALAMLRSESENENTLINDPEFREMEKTMPTKSSWLFYSSGSMLSSLIGDILTPEAKAVLTVGSLSGIGGVALSLTPSNGMVYTSLSVRYGTVESQPGLAQAGDEITATATTGDGTGTAATATTGAGAVTTAAGTQESSALKLLWRVKLDAEPAVRPFFFINHNTRATEIFIQDQNNNVYLISSTGKILWKAPIRERIAGDIFMIDYYRNGKYQLLFAGKNYLHLIDRNGNYVDRFPVKMRSPASSSLAVFDYENNMDYRLFIAGEDKKIYAYDRSGTPVKGWNMFATRGRVTDPVEFFRVRGKDYLFIADDQAIYVLDRTGNIRVAHQEPLRKATGSAARLMSGDEPAIVFSAPDGTAVRLLFDGSVKKDTISIFSSGHRSDFADLDGDDSIDYLYLDHGMLRTYDSKGSERYSYTFESEQLTGPVIFTTGPTERRTAVYETGRKVLHLIGRSGGSMPGFPMKAGQHYNIGRVSNKSVWNLIINQNDLYLYNYELSSSSK